MGLPMVTCVSKAEEVGVADGAACSAGADFGERGEWVHPATARSTATMRTENSLLDSVSRYLYGRPTPGSPLLSHLGPAHVNPVPK